MKGERATEEGKGGGDEGSRGVRGRTLLPTLQTHSCALRHQEELGTLFKSQIYKGDETRHQQQTLQLLGRTKETKKDFPVIRGRDGAIQPELL